MEDKIKTLEASLVGLQEQIKAQVTELDGLKAQNEALTEHVLSLTEKLDTFKAPLAGVSASVGDEKRHVMPEAKPFKIGSKEVRFKFAAFFLHGQKVFAHEVAQDKDLREKVAKEYPGLIEPAE